MHFGDSIFIFLLALVLFGPKKLPEIGRQVGKLLAEFRRASNEFKFQIQEEMRNLEEEERRKKTAEREAQGNTTPADQYAETAKSGPNILPPATGAPVATSFGYSYPDPAEPEAEPEDPKADPFVEPPAPQAAIAPELIPGPAAAEESRPPGNGSHAAAEPALEPAHEVARHD